jgi:hypothetical protein
MRHAHVLPAAHACKRWYLLETQWFTGLMAGCKRDGSTGELTTLG